MSTMPAGSNSATHPRGPQSKCRAFREALTSSTPAWPFGTFSSAKRCGQRICHRVLPPALASLPATPYTARPRVASSRGARRRLCRHHPASTPPDDAQSPRQPRRSWNGVQSSRVYHCVFRHLADLPAFNEVYSQYFGSIMPASTTIQQIAPAERKADHEDHYPDLEQVSLIAVRVNPLIEKSFDLHISHSLTSCLVIWSSYFLNRSKR